MAEGEKKVSAKHVFAIWLRGKINKRVGANHVSAILLRVKIKKRVGANHVSVFRLGGWKKHVSTRLVFSRGVDKTCLSQTSFGLPLNYHL